MGQPNVDKIKEEISGYYIKDFKKELGWIKSLALLPIESKVKDILTGKKELPEKFTEAEEFGWWKDIINFITPETANKIFDFMKEKRIAIEQRKTESELLQLRTEVLGGNVIQSQPEVIQDDLNQGQTQGQTQGQIQGQDQNPEFGVSSGGDASLTQQSQGDGEQQQDGEQDDQMHSSMNDHAIEAGLGTSVGFGGAARVIDRMSGSYDIQAMQEGIDANKVKETIGSCVENLEKQLNDQEKAIGHRMGKRKIETIRKNIEKIKKGMGEIEDGTVDILKEWQKFQKEIPSKLLETSGLTQSQLWKLEKYADDLAEVGGDTAKMRQILKSHGLGEINEDVLKIFASAQSKQELKTMTRIVANGRKITRIAQTLSSALMVDVIFSGLDVWMYFETRKEAELIEKVNKKRAENKYNQANYQLMVGVGSVVLEAILICSVVGSVGGPIGTAIGVGVGLLAGALSMGGDALYFDVQDFYTQNKEDFIRQKKSQVNQAILQGIHNKKEGNSSINESVHEYFASTPTVALVTMGVFSGLIFSDRSEIRETKEISLRDACWSLLFLDELDDGEFSGSAQLYNYLNSGKSREEFVGGLSQEEKESFESAWSAVNERIAKRMEYLDLIFTKPDVIEKLRQGSGMDYLNSIIIESKGYVKMKEDDKRDGGKSYLDNIESYKEEFFKEISKEKLDKFERLKESDIELFQEILATVDLSGFVGEDDTTNENYLENLKLVKKYKEWMSLTQTQGEKITLRISDYDRSTDFIEKLISVDFDLSKVVYSTISQERIVALINGNWERRGLLDISDNPAQNVLFRLAKELYGYTGENTKEGIMGFFDEGNDATHGIYFSNKWIINNDRAIDSSVEWKDLHRKTFNSQEEVDQYVASFISDNIGEKSTIDTPTEAIDEYLQKEFKEKFSLLLKEELSFRIDSNQKKIQDEITEFVKNHGNNGEYLELPYYLLLKAKKAGLGDFQRKFFRWEDNQLEVCVMPSEIHDNVLDAKITYISTAREEFTEEEKYYIDRVEKAHKKLQSIRKKNGEFLCFEQFEDDLDLPAEVERTIGDKYKEWEKFKTDIKLYGETAATSTEIYEKYEEFAEYFENIYRGILLLESTFKSSNDVDSYAYFSQVLAYGSMNLFDDNGKIKEELKSDDSNLDVFKDKSFNDFYEEQISVQRIDGKTVAELWSSDILDEKSLARQASNLIITTIFEEGILDFDDSGTVNCINIGKTEVLRSTVEAPENYGKNYHRGKSKQKTEKKISNKLKKIKMSPQIDKNKIIELSSQGQEIKNVSEEETKIIKGIPELQKQIEGTKDNIVWQDRRGDIVYNPEKSTIKSWGTEVKVKKDGDFFYLNGLSVPLAIDEVGFVANLRNWVVSEMAGEKIDHGYTQVGVFERRKGLLKKTGALSKDIMILKDNDLTGKYGISMSDSDIDDLAKWLNDEV